MIEGFYMLSQLEELGLIPSATGEPAKRSALMKYCNISLLQMEIGETPMFRMNDGTIGCRLVDNKFWLVHEEAVANWVPPKMGRPIEEEN